MDDAASGALKSSIVLTTDLGLGSGRSIFDGPTVAGMLDRLAHRSSRFNITGESYSMGTQCAHADKPRRATADGLAQLSARSSFSRTPSSACVTKLQRPRLISAHLDLPVAGGIVGRGSGGPLRI